MRTVDCQTSSLFPVKTNVKVISEKIIEQDSQCPFLAFMYILTRAFTQAHAQAIHTYTDIHTKCAHRD